MLAAQQPSIRSTAVAFSKTLQAAGCFHRLIAVDPTNDEWPAQLQVCLDQLEIKELIAAISSAHRQLLLCEDGTGQARCKSRNYDLSGVRSFWPPVSLTAHQANATCLDLHNAATSFVALLFEPEDHASHLLPEMSRPSVTNCHGKTQAKAEQQPPCSKSDQKSCKTATYRKTGFLAQAAACGIFKVLSC